MAVMLLDHARIAMAQLSRNHRERHIAHGEPAGIGMAQTVEIHGRIDPPGLTGRSKRALLFGFGPRFPLLRRNRRALPGFPAARPVIKSRPSRGSTTWRGLPLLLERTRTVPASGLKSATAIAANSPYRQPVNNAPVTSTRKSGEQAFVNRRVSSS